VYGGVVVVGFVVGVVSVWWGLAAIEIEMVTETGRNTEKSGTEWQRNEWQKAKARTTQRFIQLFLSFIFPLPPLLS
jgi:hypothetical protein